MTTFSCQCTELTPPFHCKVLNIKIGNNAHHICQTEDKKSMQWKRHRLAIIGVFSKLWECENCGHYVLTVGEDATPDDVCEKCGK